MGFQKQSLKWKNVTLSFRPILHVGTPPDFVVVPRFLGHPVHAYIPITHTSGIRSWTLIVDSNFSLYNIKYFMIYNIV